MEYRNYPEGVSNFANGSILYDLAVKLAFGMVETRRAEGRPMVTALGRNPRWEMADVKEVPAVRLWMTFLFRAPDLAEYEYAVGGVIIMQVRELKDGSQYLIPKSSVEPGVVLQRVDAEP